MNFEMVDPKKSCGNGGRKIYMVSTSPIPQDVEPVFQIFSKKGQRLPNMEHLLSQPIDQSNFLVLWASIILITPSQPNLDVIVSNGWVIKLAARRQSDGAESITNLEFSYMTHPLDAPCIFCDMNLDYLNTELGLLKHRTCTTETQNLDY